MQLFYTNDIQGDRAYLTEAEARHCIQVLRRTVGDHLQWVDGLGHWYEGTIIEVAKKRCVLQIEEKRLIEQRPFQVHLAIAPTKNVDRLEWFLEKCTEIGIDRVTPILCQRSERRRLRHDRSQKVLIAAMKQSLKTYLPQLDELIDYKTFLQQQAHSQRFIAHCGEGEKLALKERYALGQDVTILIGPEGDFSAEEIQLAEQQGYQAVSLGQSRLRTETAGVVACHTIHLLNA